MSLHHLKVGDRVNRQMGSDGPVMEMVVVDVSDNRLVCKPVAMKSDVPLDELWSFDRMTGVEEDAELGWGVKFGVTGSKLAVVV